MRRPCDLTKKQTELIDKWDLVWRDSGVSSGRSPPISLRGGTMMKRRCLENAATHMAGYESHMWDPRCHCSRSCFSKCVTKCVGSQLGSWSRVQQIFRIGCPKLRGRNFTGQTSVLKRNQGKKRPPMIFFVIICRVNDRQRLFFLRSICRKQNMLIQSGLGFEAEVSKPQSTLIHHFSAQLRFIY